MPSALRGHFMSWKNMTRSEEIALKVFCKNQGTVIIHIHKLWSYCVKSLRELWGLAKDFQSLPVYFVFNTIFCRGNLKSNVTLLKFSNKNMLLFPFWFSLNSQYVRIPFKEKQKVIYCRKILKWKYLSQLDGAWIFLPTQSGWWSLFFFFFLSKIVICVSACVPSAPDEVKMNFIWFHSGSLLYWPTWVVGREGIT